MGLLIWTELSNFTILTDEAKRRARERLTGMLERDWNPSIGIWTSINESWAIDLTDPTQRAWLSETYLWFKELDPTRLVRRLAALARAHHSQTADGTGAGMGIHIPVVSKPGEEPACHVSVR